MTKHCPGHLFTYRWTSQGINKRLSSSKYRLNVVKFNHCKFKLSGFKKNQVLHSAKVRCINISNLANTKVAEFPKYNPHGWSYHLFSVKSTIKELQKVFIILKCCSKNNFHIYMISKYRNRQNHCKCFLFTKRCTNQG